MLKFRSSGAQCLSLLHGLRRTLLYSSSSEAESTYSFVNYLVDSLGFSEQQASSLSVKLTRFRLLQGTKKVSDLDSIQKADLVVSFLKQNGFDQSHIRHIACYDPRTLRSKIDENLKLRLAFFREHGLVGSNLVQFVTENPALLCKSLNSRILPAVQALRKVLSDDGNSFAFPKKLHHNIISGLAKNLLPNVALLQSYGVPIESIRKRVILQPSPFVRKTKSFEDLLIRVEEKWKIPRSSPMFLPGVQLISRLSDEIMDSKYQLFKSFGWTESDIHEIIRQNPNCFGFSEGRIKKSLEFFMNELHYKPAEIASRPPLLICSLDKRILPRHRVLQTLKDKALIRMNYSLYSAVVLVEPVFVKRFVLPFKEVHEVYAECTGDPLQLLSQGKEDTHP